MALSGSVTKENSCTLFHLVDTGRHPHQASGKQSSFVVIMTPGVYYRLSVYVKGERYASLHLRADRAHTRHGIGVSNTTF